MNLKYTPRTINEIEVEAKAPLVNLIQVFSINTLVLLISKGLGVSKEKAFDELDAYLSEDVDPKHDTMSLFMDILESLQNGGFLPRALNVNNAREQLSNLDASEQNTLVNNGVNPKQPQ